MKVLYFLVAAATLTFATSCGNKSDETASDAQDAVAQADDIPVIMSYEEAGKAYAEEQMKQDPELKKTASGLVYKLINEGQGELFKEDDTVMVIYEGRHTDGTVFDSSKGQPVAFPLSAVVKGFREMLLMMRPGAKALVIIPGNLAYGPQGSQNPYTGEMTIKPNETLVFDMEAVGLEK